MLRPVEPAEPAQEDDTRDVGDEVTLNSGQGAEAEPRHGGQRRRHLWRGQDVLRSGRGGSQRDSGGHRCVLLELQRG